jgi:hypothetical protein
VVIGKGQRVSHRRYGEGQVTEKRHGGYEVMVHFDSELRLWLRANEVRAISEPTMAEENTVLQETEAILDRIMGSEFQKARTLKRSDRVAEAAWNSRASNDPELRDDRLAIEAFRLGIVPEHAVRAWTVGRDLEVDKIIAWLKDASSGTLVMEGAYGSGKSHVLAVLCAEGVEQNWAVASVGIDPTDSPAGFPKRVYRHAIRNLRVPIGEEVVGFDVVLERLCAESPDPIADHTIWSRVHALWNEKPKLRPHLVAYLKGRPTKRRLVGLPNLPDHTTAANVYCYLLSGLSVWLTETFGLKGMLMLIDEAEMSRTYRYTYEWSRGVNFFNGLGWMADDDDVLEDEAIEKLDCFRGERSGLVYSGFVKVPYIYRIPCHFKAVFAFTPGYTRFFHHLHTENMVHLDLPDKEDLLKLFDRLADSYAALYDLNTKSPALRETAGVIVGTYSHSFRYLIKGFVELLDHRRFYPEENPHNQM